MALDIDPAVFPVLTYDDFVSFLDNHVRMRACDCCGEKKWTISTADGVKVNMVLSPYTTQAHMSMMSAPVMCVKCGNTRLFVYQAIAEAMGLEGVQ